MAQTEYQRQYYQENKERIKKRTKRWKKDNKARCAVLYHDWYLKHKTEVLKQGYQWKMDYPVKYLIATAKSRAKNQGREFNLSAEDLHVPTHCPISGHKLVWHFGKNKPRKHWDNSPSIDRIDSSKGYTKDNVVVISWRMNRLKNNATPKELRLLADFYSPISTQSKPASS